MHGCSNTFCKQGSIAAITMMTMLMMMKLTKQRLKISGSADGFQMWWNNNCWLSGRSLQIFAVKRNILFYYKTDKFLKWRKDTTTVSACRPAVMRAPGDVSPGHMTFAPLRINLIAPLSTCIAGSRNGSDQHAHRSTHLHITLHNVT